MNDELYLLKFWGEGQEKAAQIALSSCLYSGSYGGTHCRWFGSVEARDNAEREIRRASRDDDIGIVATNTADGLLAIHRCEGRFVALYQGKEYPYVYDAGYGTDTGLLEFMFTDGNYACDDNRSIFLHEKYGDAFPEIGQCGSEITHVKAEYVLIRAHPGETYNEELEAV